MENKTEIKFYSGTRKIGGTVISIEYGDNRIILDFGRGITPLGFAADNISRDIIKKYLRLGILPKIDGFYSENDILDEMKILPLEKYGKITKVFISHLHLDHMQHMGLIDNNIEVYMTEESLKLYSILEKIGEGVIGERAYNIIHYGETLKFGDICVTSLRVDHDVMGATAYFVKTPDLTVLYSGDLRLSGSHPEWTLNMAHEAEKLGVNLLILESTTVGNEAMQVEASKEAPSGEKNLTLRIVEELKEKNEIAFFNIYHRNIDRIMEFYEASKKLKRKLVLELATAYIAKNTIDINDFYVIEEEKLELNKFNKEVIDFYNNAKKLCLENINLEGYEYLVQNSFDNIIKLLDIDFGKAVYIHSNGTPLGDYDPSYNGMKEFLRKLNIEYKYIGSTGHATPKDLKYLAEIIKPNWFIPIHGFYPENIHINCGIRFLPEEGKTYVFNSQFTVHNAQ
ncbi:MBL fold metallo-hydrolase [Clostridium hydrogenum]|uniref:MBL fold metallo-hydrolase n=1 Tax=Clostridium hydrogenum TaxID=2855764 RepID=UPI001F16CEBD|nr:MBL fold metallo-hydrolase [Clostridium hydrogenum]